MSGFEQSKFGNGSASGVGNVTKTVNTHFGKRDQGGSVGVFRTAGAKRELVIDFTGEAFNQGLGSGDSAFLVEYGLPVGALVTSVSLEVKEAFALSGTTPAIEIGTKGSEVTNGFTTSKAQLEAVGVYNLTSALSGTWAAIVAAEATVGVAASGTSPVLTNDGVARYVISYNTVG